MHACSCAYQLKGLVGHHERVKDWQRPLSCRYEVMSTDLGVLEELDIVLVGIDRTQLRLERFRRRQVPEDLHAAPPSCSNSPIPACIDMIFLPSTVI